MILLWFLSCHQARAVRHLFAVHVVVGSRDLFRQTHPKMLQIAYPGQVSDVIVLFFYIYKKSTVTRCVTGQALPPTSSSVSSLETSHVPITHLPVDATPGQIAALERPDPFFRLLHNWADASARESVRAIGLCGTTVTMIRWVMIDIGYFLASCSTTLT